MDSKNVSGGTTGGSVRASDDTVTVEDAALSMSAGSSLLVEVADVHAKSHISILFKEPGEENGRNARLVECMHAL